MEQFKNVSRIADHYKSECYQFIKIFLSFLFWLCLFYPAVSIAGQVTLAWDPNQEPDLGGYLVYWGTASSQYDQSAIVESNTSYTVTDLGDEQIYYFAVTAYDANGNESAYSAELAIKDGVVVDTVDLPGSNSPSMASDAGADGGCFIRTGRHGVSVKALALRWCRLFKGEIQ